jgi:hypothetical protein
MPGSETSATLRNVGRYEYPVVAQDKDSEKDGRAGAAFCFHGRIRKPSRPADRSVIHRYEKRVISIRESHRNSEKLEERLLFL